MTCRKLPMDGAVAPDLASQDRSKVKIESNKWEAPLQATGPRSFDFEPHLRKIIFGAPCESLT